MRPVDQSDDTLFALGQAEDFGRFTTATLVGRQSALATDDEAQRATEPQAESRQCGCEAQAAASPPGEWSRAPVGAAHGGASGHRWVSGQALRFASYRRSGSTPAELRSARSGR
jgi:hypothetical protein